jgi:hypothetical protein
VAATGPTLLDARTMDPRDYVLALALREEFNKLNVSVREYAATHNLHYSTVSNYLSCKKGLPPWTFIKALAEDAAGAHGLERPSRAMIVYLWTLLKNAEKAREKDSFDKLRAELTKARKELDEHARQERRISDQLLAAKAHIANLKSQVLALESGHVSPLPSPSTELALRDVETRLRDERASAERVIAELRARLGRERELKEKAEQDCHRFEKLIRDMLAAAGNPVGAAGDLPAAQDSPAQEIPASASASGEAASGLTHVAPPAYPAELTEWLRSRLDAKDVELEAKDGQIAELQAKVDMLLDNYRLANQKYLEERDKALHWERRCAELKGDEDTGQAPFGEGQDRVARMARSRRAAPQSWTGTEPADVRDGFRSSPPSRAAGPR